MTDTGCDDPIFALPERNGSLMSAVYLTKKPAIGSTCDFKVRKPRAQNFSRVIGVTAPPA